jgi:hypothetical protein
MLNFADEKVENYGKVTFVRRNHTIPALPDMKLIVLKKESGYQAICINIEIDAVGNSVKESCNNLRHAIFAYTKQMIDNYDGNIQEAVKDIINVSYSDGALKSQLFTLYLNAKRRHILE